jgi:hypothetical protein
MWARSARPGQHQLHQCVHLDRTPPPAAAPAGSTCILRFSAGPPYEDLAFRIINKEW